MRWIAFVMLAIAGNAIGEDDRASKIKENEAVSYGHDTAIIQDWQEKMSGNPAPAIAQLYRLWVTLCAAVDAGHMPIEEAIETFSIVQKQKVLEANNAEKTRRRTEGSGT